MARLNVTSAWTLMALALGTGCASPGEDAPQAGGGGGAGGSPGATSSAASTTGAGGGGTPYVCDPPAEAGTIWERTAESLSLDEIGPVPMCKYRGDVMLIINTAAVWGYTPQMAGLQVLEETFEGDGLEVLGFLSNDFGNQGGSDEQIDGCTEQYGVTFDQFAIDHVKDPDGAGPETAQPVFDWLLAQPNPGPSSSTEPTWNFHKWLVSRDGQLVAHWDSSVYPGDNPNDTTDSFDTSPIVVAIRAELEKMP